MFRSWVLSRYSRQCRKSLTKFAWQLSPKDTQTDCQGASHRALTEFNKFAPMLRLLLLVQMDEGRETASSGVFLVRDGYQVLQLLPMQPITIDTRLPDGVTFNPTGLLRWMTAGVVVHFAPAIADLAGLDNAVTTVLPDARVKLGSEGVLQLRKGRKTDLLSPDWTVGGVSGTDQLQMGVACFRLHRDRQFDPHAKYGKTAKQLPLLSSSLQRTPRRPVLTRAALRSLRAQKRFISTVNPIASST